MSEILARTDPVPMTPLEAEGVRLSLAPPMARYSLRARHVSAITALLGGNVPGKIGHVEGDVACLGPDEWLWRSAHQGTAPTGDAAVAVVDISERSICLIVEGPRAATILNSGCPLDLDRFAVGRATRTIYETVEIILFHESEDRWQVEVWRSFAPWLWQALSAAASDALIG